MQLRTRILPSKQRHCCFFIALANRRNHYLNTLFTRDVAPHRIYQKYDLFHLQFGFLHTKQMDVNNQTHKVNMTKMLHTIHNYLFFQHHFHQIKPIVHVNSHLQYVNTKLTSPYYLNYSLLNPT